MAATSLSFATCNVLETKMAARSKSNKGIQQKRQNESTPVKGKSNKSQRLDYSSLNQSIIETMDMGSELDDDSNDNLQDALSDALTNCKLDENMKNVALVLTSVLVPVLTQVVKTTVEKTVSEAMKGVAEINNNRITKLEKQMRLLRFGQDKMEQYSRKDNIKIFNLSESRNGHGGEDTLQEVVKLCTDKINIDIKESDIAACHRIGIQKQGRDIKPRPIIVKFVTRYPRERVLMNTRKLKETDQKHVFIAEDITMLRSKMLHLCKNTPGVKFAVTRKGVIRCRMNDDSLIMVESPDDLFKIGINNINWEELGLHDFE